MLRHARSNMNSQIYEEACAWFAESRAEDLDDVGRREFDRWLRKSPEHLSAYLEIAAIWNEGPRLDPTNKWSADTLIQQAHEADDDNVVTLVPAASPAATVSAERAPTTASARASTDMRTEVETAHGNWFRRRRWLAITASVAVMAVLGGTLALLELSAPVYITALGEQRSIQLEDGSTVELNSRSKIRVKYSKQERDVELLEGQTLFHVAHDAHRPFIVTVGATRVRAVGTQFDVYKKSRVTVVTVVEGRVAVYSAHEDLLSGTSGDPGKPLPLQGSPQPSETTSLLCAGEQLTVMPEAAQKTANANIAGATAWRERKIVFESASLSDVAEEFNRYNERQLFIEDPGALTFHVSGVFSSTDPASLIRFLKQRPGVKVTETKSQVRIARNISPDPVTNR
jgi:transmembrane sensor